MGVPVQLAHEVPAVLEAEVKRNVPAFGSPTLPRTRRGSIATRELQPELGAVSLACVVRVASLVSRSNTLRSQTISPPICAKTDGVRDNPVDSSCQIRSSCRSVPADYKGEPEAFIYKLELEDGHSLTHRPFETAVPTWRAGDTISLGREASPFSVRADA